MFEDFASIISESEVQDVANKNIIQKRIIIRRDAIVPPASDIFPKLCILELI